MGAEDEDEDEVGACQLVIFLTLVWCSSTVSVPPFPIFIYLPQANVLT
jgi:hypothetical protein